jgi:hypothetical protein
VRLRGVAFRAVDGRVRGRIDDHLRAQLAHAGQQLIGVGEIALPAIQRGELAKRRGEAREFPADLAVASQEQQLQG